MGRMDDGFSTTIDFSGFPTLTLVMWEKTVTPPGVDGGGPNETTTMRNTALRTNAPKKLKSMTEGSATVAYDPAIYPTLFAMINVNQLITINYPDGSSIAFWGWLNSFEPGEIVEGEQPTADLNFQCSNQDETGTETAPVYNGA
jgi:hypothetical protein